MTKTPPSQTSQNTHSTSQLTIALVGQPNVGKSSLINAISGANLKVGNFSGVTVQKDEVRFSYKDTQINIVDLPGTYSLNDYSPDEKITKDFLESRQYDIVLNVLDSTNLARNLALSAQIMGLGVKCVLGLNMIDEAKADGIEIDTELLSEILGVACIPISAQKRHNIHALFDTLIDTHNKPFCEPKRIYDDLLESSIGKIEEFLLQKSFYELNSYPSQKEALSSRIIAILLLRLDTNLYAYLHDKPCYTQVTQFVNEVSANLTKQSGEENIQSIFNQDSISFAQGAAQEVLSYKKPPLLDEANLVRETSTDFAISTDSLDSTQSQTSLKPSTNSTKSPLKNFSTSLSTHFGKNFRKKDFDMPSSLERTKRIDFILLHKFFGLPIFFLLMFLLFEMTFYVGGFAKDYIEDGFAKFGEFLGEVLASHPQAISLICDGIIGGVGTVLAFLPLIAVLYFGIAILEGSGYMARVAFLFDGFLHKFGLHGKSFIPMIAGFGCSVPAYMATRTLKNQNERLITLFVIGFMSCSARLPIYVLFVGAFFPEKYAGFVLFGIYVLGGAVALMMAKVLKLSLFRGRDEPFVMEMPKYRIPNFRTVWFSIWGKVVMFLKKAGGFILIASVLIWFASQYPKNPQIDEIYEAKKQEVLESKNLSEEQKNEEIAHLENEQKEKFLRGTYSGRVGEILEPVFAPMGFDWRLSISIVTGFAAKEVVVSTLGVLYSLGEGVEEDSSSLQQMLRDSISFPSAVAFVVFVMFYIPCFAATISFGREAGGIKFVGYLFVFTTIVAYIFSLISYWVALLGYSFFMR
ncbi:ferrous iron transport protein B [Helicobacter macacae]|uniref:Ferrous iron transport protein B n=1 Tax=Helicobacter macacae MIT 99-5501 TaxID=1357400 RepID=V8CAU8_9HELI|nr:ferrous iron transport protein B [Helicobacter macacae]ETD24232.1 ferrous iron transporter B [Helicobacter macacae MIT 99-5501]